tara:strand:- start:150 stop:353 length:204 start_codon:yes stop_codon:yes gene_type:complete
MKDFVVHGFPVRLLTRTNRVIIIDEKNVLEREDSAAIMKYLDEEGFFEKLKFNEEKPIRVEIYKKST